MLMVLGNVLGGYNIMRLNRIDSRLFGNLSTAFENLSGSPKRDEKAELPREEQETDFFLALSAQFSIVCSPLQVLTGWTSKVACHEGYKAAIEKQKGRLNV